jgi:hypothetical protein
MNQTQITAIVTAVLAALEEPQVTTKAVAKPKAKVAATPKVSKKAKKAANQKLMRSINGKLAAATRATTKAKARGFLKEAMKMTPANWTSVQNQIVRKHETLGITV